MSADARVCAWCMHLITDDCRPETVWFAGRALTYCDAPDHSCYSEHVPSGARSNPLQQRPVICERCGDDDTGPWFPIDGYRAYDGRYLCEACREKDTP